MVAINMNIDMFCWNKIGHVEVTVSVSLYNLL